MASFLLGCSTNSLIVLGLEGLCLLLFSNRLFEQAIIYFSSTGLLLIIMALCFVSLTKKFRVQEKVNMEWSKIKQTYAEIWPEALTVTLNYTVTLTCFPGLLLNINYFQLDTLMKSLFVVGVFNSCDFLGRFTTSLVNVPSKKVIRTAAVLRILLIVTTILALIKLNLGAPFDSNWYVVLNLIILGYSHGLTGTFAMIQGTMSSTEPEVGGYIMGFHLTCGLALGSIFAYIISLSRIV